MVCARALYLQNFFSRFLYKFICDFMTVQYHTAQLQKKKKKVIEPIRAMRWAKTL